LEREYRADIDGLRAIAVGIVVLFHLRISGFDGGYAGVDIFFVISGYLITGHILRDLALQQFSFAEFYARRARRILPALIATIALTVAAGWLWLPPEFLRQVAKEATHGLLSISNIQYWREANQYFAPSSDQLGLLHLWSLSLEEQFYLGCPLALVLLSRTRRVFPGIAAAGLVSLVAAIIWLPRDSEAVFFLTPFRVFEFALGALAIPLEKAIAGVPTARRMAVWFGYLLLGGSLVVLGRFQRDAGLAALPPCIAIVAIIAANRPVRVLANSVVLALGRASYSLYLVHWPVIVFARFIFGGDAEAPAGVAAQLAIMALLTVVIHLAVEQPLRRLGAVRWKQAAGFAATIVAGVVLTHATYKAEGFTWRLPAEQLARLDLQSFGMFPCAGARDRGCDFGALDGGRQLDLVGDSFVQQYVAALDEPLKARGIRGYTSTVSGCPLLLGVTLPGWRAQECADLRDQRLARVQESASDFVVIGQAWHIYLEPQDGRDELRQRTIVGDGLAATIRFLDRPGRRFLIVGGQVRPERCNFDRMRMLPGPLWHAPPPPCDPVPRDQAIAATEAINNLLSAAIEGHANVTLLRPADVYCESDCPVVSDGLWLYLDSGHFTVAGSRRMGERAGAIIDRFLSDTEQAASLPLGQATGLR
jgi:peptidoglycan/LPS O-acetylase OafA/YrhL